MSTETIQKSLALLLRIDDERRVTGRIVRNADDAHGHGTINLLVWLREPTKEEKAVIYPILIASNPTTVAERNAF